MVTRSAKSKSNYQLGNYYNVILQPRSGTSYLSRIVPQPGTLGFERMILSFHMGIHTKAFLGELINFSRKSEASGLPGFPGAGQNESLNIPDFIRTWRVGYFGCAYPNGCSWSFPGKPWPSHVRGQAIAITHFYTVIPSLMNWEFFSCHIWWWDFSGERQQSLHLCVCELKTLPAGNSLDQQPRFPGCRSRCANTRRRGSHPDFNENCTPNHKVIYGFGLAPPSNFYGVLLFSDHGFPQNI